MGHEGTPGRDPERALSVALSVARAWPRASGATCGLVRSRPTSDPLRHQWLAALLGSSALQKAAQPSSLVSPASPEEQAGWDGALPFCVATCATCACTCVTAGLPASATATAAPTAGVLLPWLWPARSAPGAQ